MPESLEDAVRQALDEDRCTSAALAERDLRERLIRLGYVDWSIHFEIGVQPDSCVAASIDTSRKRIRLGPALRPEVRRAMQEAADYLIENCLGRQEAVDYLTSMLIRLEEVNFEIRTDGPFGIPLDRVDEVLRHVEAGCWVYSGTGWTAQGRALFFLSGR